MKLTVLRFLVLPAVLGIGLTAGCGAPSTAAEGPSAEAVELRTYSVPAGYESQVPSMLRSAFGSEGVGRVSVGPAGKILVLAPASVQRGVEAFFEELEQVGPPPAGPRPVLLSYWIVLGVPDPELSGYDVEGTASLGEIENALSEIVRTQGPQRFRLLERVLLTSVGEEWAQAAGNQVHVQQRATLVGDVVVSDVQVTVRGHRLQTQVKLQPEQVAVLAQTGVGDWAQSAQFRAENLYYVVASKIE